MTDPNTSPDLADDGRALAFVSETIAMIEAAKATPDHALAVMASRCEPALAHIQKLASAQAKLESALAFIDGIASNTDYYGFYARGRARDFIATMASETGEER